MAQSDDNGTDNSVALVDLCGHLSDESELLLAALRRVLEAFDEEIKTLDDDGRCWSYVEVSLIPTLFQNLVLNTGSRFGSQMLDAMARQLAELADAERAEAVLAQTESHAVH